MHQESDISAERLMEMMRDWLEDNEFPEVLVAEPNRLELTMFAPAGNWRMTVVAAGDPIVVISEQTFPIVVPTPLHAEAALLCDVLSKTVPTGDYRIDPEDGTITFKVVFPLLDAFDPSKLDTLLAELVCRPLFSFGRSLFPLAQFVTGVLDRDACVTAFCTSKDTEEAPWTNRTTPVRFN